MIRFINTAGDSLQISSVKMVETGQSCFHQSELKMYDILNHTFKGQSTPRVQTSNEI